MEAKYLYPMISLISLILYISPFQFTAVSSEASHMYLLRNSAHPRNCIKAIPFGVAMRVRKNCSTNEEYDRRSNEYQPYLIDRGYNQSEVGKQFEKAKVLSRGDLLA